MYATVTTQLSADKHHSTTTLNSILAHNLQIHFKEGFFKTIRYIEAMPHQLKRTLIWPRTTAHKDLI
jgi:hypothetical protein